MRVIWTSLFWLCHQSLDKSISEWVMWGSWRVWRFDLFTRSLTASHLWCRFLRSDSCALFRFSPPQSHAMNPSTSKITHNNTWSFWTVLSPSVVWSAHYSAVCSYSYLLVSQASGQVGHFSQVSPKAPGSVHWQRPHTQLPLPLHIWPSSEMQDAVSVEQLQLSPM